MSLPGSRVSFRERIELGDLIRNPNIANLAITLCSLFFFVLAAEILLRLFLPVPDPYDLAKQSPPRLNRYIRSEYSPNFRTTTEAEPGLMGIGPETRSFTTNNMGFRGDPLVTPKPSDEFRVFMIGGS